MSDAGMKNSKTNFGFYKNNKYTNQSETQIKSKNDIDISNRRRSQNSINNCKKKKNESEKLKNSIRIPNMRIETNMNSILHGKPLQHDVQSNPLLNINKNKESKEKNVYSSDFIKNYFSLDRHIHENYSSTALINQNEISNNNNITSNIFTNESLIAAKIKLINNCKNFNTISNIESEGFYTTKNKYSKSIKTFGNINTTYTIDTFNNMNTNINNSQNMNKAKKMGINNSVMKEDKKIKSIDLEKTKSIINNKTDYKTLTSNAGTPKLNTLNSARNSKFSKFEAKLLSHFNVLKGQKSSRIGSPINKLNLTNKKIKINTIYFMNQKSKNKNQINLSSENINNKIQYYDKNFGIIKSSENPDNRSNKIEKTIKNSNVELKLHSEPDFFTSKSNNLNNYRKTESDKNYYSVDIRLNSTVKDKDQKSRIFLSDKFKFSVDEFQRNDITLHNKLLNNKFVKRSLNNFDLNKKKENWRSLSIGERLYHKSIAMKSMKEKRASIELYKKDIETINNCSFRPRLCEDSIMMNIKSRYATINDSRNFDIDLNDSKNDNNSYFIRRNSRLIESHKLKKELEDLKELKPTIKRPEIEIIQHVEKLHNEKITLQIEREKLAELYFNEIYPFKPITNTKSDPNIANFFDRLQNWVEKRNKSYRNELISSFFDKKTGQKLFTPSISIPTKIDSIGHRNKMDLFSFLHEERKTREEKLMESEQASLRRIQENSKTKLSNQKTDEINKLLKEDCYANLFEVLDHNRDGVIECSEEFMKNALEQMDKDIFDLFKPIFNELKEHDESLTLDEFYLALDELFKILSVQQRRQILNWYVERKRIDSISRKRVIVDISNFTFKPFISERSHSYFNMSKRHARDFIDRNNDLLTSRFLYHKEQSQEKLIKEIDGCTFKPEVNKNSEKIDKRNKSAFLLSLSSLDLDFLLKPKSVAVDRKKKQV